MFTDMVGYTALTQSNESQAMEVLDRHNRLLRPFFPRFHGREIKTIGDSFLVEFDSALDALKCAVEIQSYLHDYNMSSMNVWKITLRIGIHLGDVIHKNGDVYGDAVNIASRIEPAAAPEGICISQQVYDQVGNKFELPLVELEGRPLKNVSRLVMIYAVQMPWERMTHPKEASGLPRDRIAVLPFASFSPDPNDVYFADGITDEIISTVAGISGLGVISRTSVMGYRGTTKKVGDIGKELGVGTVLEGSFKKAGNRIRVTAQLIDVATDRHLWAQNYDRNLDDVFEVQSDIARRIADALSINIRSPEIARIEKRPTQNTTAYSLYLKGRFLWNKRELDDLKEALVHFDRAVTEDPKFALGYVGKADCYSLLYRNYMIEGERNLRIADEMVTKALELDPDLAEAHTSRGMILSSQYEYREAEEEFRRAIELKPSYATAHQWYYWMLRSVCRWKEAMVEIEKAFELDPLSPVIVSNYSDCLFVLGKSREAIRELELANQLGVSNIAMLTLQFFFYLHLGKMTDAANSLEKASKIDPNDVGVLDWKGHVEYLKGNYAQAKELWEKAVEEGKRRSAEVRGFTADFALLYWTTGDKKRALACIEALKGMPEDSKYALAFKRRVLAFAYGAVNNAEGFFQTFAQLVEANQAEGGYFLQWMPTLMPKSIEVFGDPRWNDLLARVGLEPSNVNGTGL
jgi:adenylate cyclase